MEIEFLMTLEVCANFCRILSSWHNFAERVPLVSSNTVIPENRLYFSTNMNRTNAQSPIDGTDWHKSYAKNKPCVEGKIRPTKMLAETSVSTNLWWNEGKSSFLFIKSRKYPFDARILTLLTEGCKSSKCTYCT